MATAGTEASVGAGFRRDGFVVLPQLLSAEECAQLKEEAQRILDEVRAEAARDGRDPSALFPSGVYVGLSPRSERFRALAADARLLRPLREIIGPRLAFVSDKVIFKDEAREFDTPWHQDYAYWKGAHKYTAWIALDDATPENGCLKLIPGSHRDELGHEEVQRSEGFAHRIERVDESRAVAAPLARGGAVIFHDLTLHASFPNRTGRPRWAVAPTYADAGELAAEMDRWPAARVLVA